MALYIPRDRAGAFTPTLVPKGERRLGGLSDIIISLYAGGMTVRDVCHNLQRVYGTELSPDTVWVMKRYAPFEGRASSPPMVAPARSGQGSTSGSSGARTKTSGS